MAILLTLTSIFMFVWGLVLIFAKDVAWNYSQWTNSMRGLDSERTPQWESYATFRGILTLFISIGVFACSFLYKH